MQGGFSGEEFDSFWDLSSMLAQKKQAKPKQDTQTLIKSDDRHVSLPQVEITEASTVSEPLSDVNSSLRLSRTDESCSTSYKPQDSTLIQEVKLFKRPNSYSFYSQFREDAIRYLDRRSDVSDPEPFFSYIPHKFSFKYLSAST